VLLCGAVYSLASLTTEYSYWARVVVWRDATFDDFKTKFASRPIANAGTPSTLGAPPAVTPAALENIVFSRGAHRESLPIADFLERTDSRAFLIIKDGKLIFEGYAHGADHDAVVTSFSTARPCSRR